MERDELDRLEDDELRTDVTAGADEQADESSLARDDDAVVPSADDYSEEKKDSGKGHRPSA